MKIKNVQKPATSKKVFLSVVLPCRNEKSSIKKSILSIRQIFKQYHIPGEIIVSDSSTDGSFQIASELGVILVKHNKIGYGKACKEGILKSSGNYIFLADPDGSYDFTEIPRFLELLKTDYDFVIGNRLTGAIKKDAMDWKHRYIGNPLISFMVRILFRAEVGDVNCGMRAISKSAFHKIGVTSNGWDFAPEMVIKAKLNALKIIEIPIAYYPRKGKSKLNTYSAGLGQIISILYLFFSYKKSYFLKACFNTRP